MVFQASNRLRSIARTLVYAFLATLAVGLIVYIFAYLTSGFDAVIAGDWVRKVLYILACLGIIAGSGGMLFSREDRDELLREAAGERGPRWRDRPITWQAGLILGSLLAILLTYLYEFAYIAVLLR